MTAARTATESRPYPAYPVAQRFSNFKPLRRIYVFALPYADILSVSHPSPSLEYLGRDGCVAMVEQNSDLLIDTPL